MPRIQDKVFYENKRKLEHVEIIVRIKEFSNMSVTSPCDVEFINCDDLSLLFDPTWTLQAHIKRYNETEECLSIYFRCMYMWVSEILETWPGARVDVTCVVTVIDVESKRRFPRSFVISRELNNSNISITFFKIEKYISKRALFKDASVLLPNDTLSLHMDLNIVVEPEEIEDFETLFAYNSHLRDWQSDIHDDSDMEMCYLRMDSNLWKILCEESSYFQRLTSSPMMEKREIYKIPFEEGDTLRRIERILCCGSLSIFPQLLYDLYRTAEMYDIQVVVDLCRRCLELSLTQLNATDIAEFASVFNDDRLREAAEAFLATDCEDRNKVVCEVVVQSRMSGVKYEWIFRLHCESDEFFSEVFVELYNKKKYTFEEKDAYDFYS